MTSTSARLDEWRLALREAEALPEGSEARRMALYDAEQARLRYAIEVEHAAAHQAALAGPAEANAPGAEESLLQHGTSWRTTTGG